MQEILQQVLSAARGMWRYRWQGLAVSWVVALIAAIAVMRIPDQYQASARVYVDTDSILKPLMSGLAVQPNVQQQIDMLSRTLISRPNLEKLVRMADLDLKVQTKEEQDALIDRLSRSIQIRGAGGVNLYLMAYSDREQDKAKRVVQALVSMFVESSLGASRKDTDSAKTFLDEQIKTFEAKLEEAEARVQEFRLRNLERQGGGDGKDAASRIGEISAQLNNARLQLREAERARDASRRQLAEARGQAPSATALPDLLGGVSSSNNARISTPEFDGRIASLKGNLDGLLQRYTEQHPDVVSTRRLLADLEAAKAKEVAELQRRAAAQAAATASTPGLALDSLATQELNRMLATAEVQVASLQARVDEYAARYAQAREALKTAPQIETEAAQLNRDYAITKKGYEDLVARRQSAVMSGELDVASGVAEFRLIDPPRVSPKPVSPNRLLLLPMALVVALGAGLFVAFAASQLRPTFYDPTELRNKTGLPLLGVVSLVSSDADRKRERGSLIRFASAAGGLVGLFAVGLVTLSLMGQ